MYCEKCGQLCEEIKQFYEYDRNTGEKKYWTNYKCPTHGSECYRSKMLHAGCFIATAAYGTELDPRLDILRAFRDQVLIPNKLGKGFVDFYYKYSPPIADLIRPHESVRAVIRAILKPIIAIVEKRIR